MVQKNASGHLGTCSFREAFFGWSVYDWEKRHGPARVVETDLSPLYAADLVPDPAPPAAFVFHCSRCGSTLLARILSHDPEGLLLSEPDALNALLFPLCQRPAPGAALSSETRTLLRNVLLALGRRRGLKHTRSHVKFTSWNVLLLDVIREVFPEVPVLFLHRDPGAILVSIKESPTGFSQPDDDPFSRFVAGTPPTEPVLIERLSHTTKVLRRMFEIAAADPKVAALDHRDLTPANLPRILRHFGLAPTPDVMEAMLREFGVYSKNYGPDVAYTDDSAGKAQALTPELAAAAATLVPYRARLGEAGRNLVVGVEK